MRLPRHVKMLRGPIDASALAGTVFLLWMGTFLHSSLVMPAGIRLELPAAEGLWGEALPGLTVAVDAGGRLLFEHQILAETNLQARLGERVGARGGANQTLLLLADRAVNAGQLARLANLARQAGVAEVVIATSPRPVTPRPPTVLGGEAEGGR